MKCLISMLVWGAVLATSFAATAAAQSRDVRSAADSLAIQLSALVPSERKLRVAVADFVDLQGVSNDLGRFIASRLTTRLAQNATFAVVERQRLGQVLAELKFSMSDLVDPDKAKQLGGMVGVEALIVGTMSQLGSEIDIDARIIEIESNELLGAATATIEVDDLVEGMIGRGRQELTRDPEAEVEGEGRPGLRYGQTVDMQEYSFRLDNCQREATRFVCLIFVTTRAERGRRLYFHGSESYLLDQHGVEYQIVRLDGCRKTGSSWRCQLPPAVEKRVVLVFGVNGPPGTAEPASVVIRWSERGVPNRYVVFK